MKNAAKVLRFRWIDISDQFNRESEMIAEISTTTGWFRKQTTIRAVTFRGDSLHWFFRETGEQVTASWLTKILDSRYRTEKWEIDDKKVEQKLIDKLSDNGDPTSSNPSIKFLNDPDTGFNIGNRYCS